MRPPTILSEKNHWLEISFEGDFSTARTFDCGQCFRFGPLSDEISPPSADCQYAVSGIAYGKQVAFADNGTHLYVYATPEDFQAIWKQYLGLDADYVQANQQILQSLAGASQGSWCRIRIPLDASRAVCICCRSAPARECRIC